MTDSATSESCCLFVLQSDPQNPNRPMFKVVHTLSEDDYNINLSVASRIQDSLNGYLVVYVKQALENLLSAASQIERIISTNPIYAIQASVDKWNTAIACCILTFCSALHLHQEQSKILARRNNEEDSAAFGTVKNAFAKAYDDCFAYRLLYRLRNELVHHSFRAIGLKLSGTEMSPSGLIVNQYAVKVPLNKHAFLSSAHGISAAIRTELNGMTDDPDLLDLCQQVMPALDEVDQKIKTILNPGLISDAQALLDLESLFGNHQSDIKGLARIRYSAQGLPVQVPQHVLKSDLFDYCRILLLEGG